AAAWPRRARAAASGATRDTAVPAPALPARAPSSPRCDRDRAGPGHARRSAPPARTRSPRTGPRGRPPPRGPAGTGCASGPGGERYPHIRLVVVLRGRAGELDDMVVCAVEHRGGGLGAVLLPELLEPLLSVLLLERIDRLGDAVAEQQQRVARAEL